LVEVVAVVVEDPQVDAEDVTVEEDEEEEVVGKFMIYLAWMF
jgi:hypothetical protein